LQNVLIFVIDPFVYIYKSFIDWRRRKVRIKPEKGIYQRGEKKRAI